jgi:hypothetical protein
MTNDVNYGAGNWAIFYVQVEDVMPRSTAHNSSAQP